MLLVRTPSPFPNESFSGYLIRVTEENGYSSLSDILSVAGASPRWKGGWKIEVEDVERALSFPSGKLQSIANYTAGQGRESATLLGQEVSSSHLAGSRPKICPECVAEMGFIEAHWDLRLMVACPKHRRRAVSSCWQCGELLNLDRPKMLQCKCGANLTEVLGEPTDDVVMELMSILSSAALKCAMPQSSSFGMPVVELSAMSLRGLTTTILCLGANSMESLGLQDTDASELIVAQAGDVLANWPEGFRALLRRLKSQRSADESVEPKKFREHFAKLYDALFKRGLPDRETEFLRRAFVEFGMDEWTDGVVDPRLARGIAVNGARFQSLGHVAKEMGVTLSTARKMARKGQLPLVVKQNGKRTQFIGVPDATLSVRRAPGASYGIREAAALLGVPVSVLNGLRQSGHFPVRYLGSQVKCFHERDLYAFNELCMAAAARSHTIEMDDDQRGRGAGVIELGRVLQTMKFGNTEGKISLVVALLEGRLTSRGSSGEWMGSILLDANELELFRREHRSAGEPNTKTFGEAAATIQCDPDAVNSLVKQQLLVVVAGYCGQRITNESIAAFCEKFIALGDIAKRHGTSSRRLAAICDEKEVELLVAMRACSGIAQNFITRESAAMVETHLLSQKTSENVANEPRVSSLDLLQQYFRELRKRGDLLPRRNGKPNKSAIAQACGVGREIFQSNSEGAKLLDLFDEEEQARTGIPFRDPVKSLREYLDDLANSNKLLPRINGQPNKHMIAEACNFNRNLFYRDADIAAALDNYDRSEPR